MKRSFKFLFLVVVSLCAVACSQTKNETSSNNDAAEVDFRNSLGASDSLAVLQQGDSIMSLLKSGNMESAFANLFELSENGEVVALTDGRKKQLSRQFKIFPVQDFVRRDVQFNTAEQNIVTYDIIFDQANNARTSFALSPIKQGGAWYFTVRGASTADGHDMKSEVEAEE